MLRLRTVAVAVALIAGLLALGAVAAPAAAHDELLSSTPASGATLNVLPEKVTLTFSAPLKPEAVQLAVVDSKTINIGDGGVTIDGPTATQRLKAQLPDGEYRVSYRVISTDGHPVNGTYSFTIRGVKATDSPPAPSSKAAAKAPASSTKGDQGWLWWLIAVVVLFGLVAAGAALRRLGGAKSRNGA